ncbi:MFS transporter [Bacillus sp. F19]|nr:MFS transporter [Bacillus sp. F19]
MKAGLFKPLKVPAYRSLFGAQVFSDLGNWLDFIALQVIIAYHWHHGEGAIAALITIMALPWVLIGPFASVFVDHLPKKKVMLICLLFRLVFVIGLFFSPSLHILLLFVLLKGIAAALYDPARQSAIRMTVSEEQLPEAVTLSTLSVNSMKIIGPSLGGLLIALYGVRSPFIAEIIGFAAAIGFLAFLPELKTEAVHNEKEKKSYLHELKEGISHINRTALLRASILFASLSFFIIFLYDGLFIFIIQKLGFDDGSFGVVMSAVGFGSVIGSLIIGQWTAWKNRSLRFMAIATLFSGIFIVMTGLGGLKVFVLDHWVWFTSAFMLGLLGSVSSIPFGYLLQSETPKELMGRVSAAAMALQTLAMLSAPTAGAIIANWIGSASVLVYAGAATIVLGALAAIYKPSSSSKNSGIRKSQGYPL